jgi:hypothetical protein
MKKLLKISSLVAIAGLVAFNTYMATDIFKSNGTDLASVFSLSEVMAEQTDGGEEDEEDEEDEEETEQGNEVLCYSSATFSLLSRLYDCGDCCAMFGSPTGETLKCNHNADDC